MAIKTEFLEGVETSARMYRGILTDLFTEGVKNVSAGHFRVVQRAAGANMTVTVLKGTDGNAVGYITGDDYTGQGLYRAEMDADILDIAIGGAPASGSRTDLVVLETVDKTAVGGSVNETRVRVLPGQSSLSASNKTMIPLASIAVAAGQASVVTANITDLRTQAGAASLKVGTQAQPLSAAQIAAFTSADKYAGRLVFNSDTKRAAIFDGTDSAPLGSAAFGTTPVGVLSLSTTFITAAYFIGTGFQQVDFTFGPATTSSGSNPGMVLTAVADPTRARGVISIGNSTTMFNPSNTTDAGQFLVGGNSNGRIRNVRLDSDGYLRMELGTVTGTYSTASTDRINWGAR